MIMHCSVEGVTVRVVCAEVYTICQSLLRWTYVRCIIQLSQGAENKSVAVLPVLFFFSSADKERDRPLG